MSHTFLMDLIKFVIGKRQTDFDEKIKETVTCTFTLVNYLLCVFLMDFFRLVLFQNKNIYRTKGTNRDKYGQKGQIWSNMTKYVQNGPKGYKRLKRVQKVKRVKKGPKGSKRVKRSNMIKYGQKGPKS